MGRQLLLALALMLALPGALAAHETDNYSVPFNQEFADIGPLLDDIFYRNITRAVEDVNAKIERAVHNNAPRATIEKLQSPETLAYAVRYAFPATLSMIDDIERMLYSKQFAQKYPGLVPAYKPFSCIYDHASFVLDPRQVFKLWRASTVRVGDTNLGTDKIGHFLCKGYINYDLYVKELAKHGDHERAARSVIDLGTGDDFFYSEKRMVGYFSSGVYSHGDLCADYAGLLFYRNLTEQVKIQGEMRPPMLTREGDYWVLAPHVRDGDGLFTSHVTNHFDEVLNPNVHEALMRNAVRTAVEKRASRLLEWYADELGNRRSRAWFEKTMHEFATYYGEEYGHDDKWDVMITISNTCFPAFDFGDDVTLRSPYGETVLHVAAARGEVDRIRQLIAAGADVNAPVRSLEPRSAHWGDTPLHDAAAEGQRAAVEALLDAGAKLQARNDHGVTPLHRAVRSAEVLALLLDKGAEVNAADDRGLMPLHWAAGYGATDAVAALLARKADIQATDHRGQTALHWAARFDRSEVIAALVAQGAKVDAPGELGLTPLHLAVRQNKMGAVKALLDAGADANALDDFGCTPLHDAASRNRVDAARLLLTAGASPAARDAFHSTPLHVAAARGHIRLCAMLLDAGASPLDTNERGRTPLHDAAAHGQLSVMDLLQSRGADPARRDRDGHTAAQLAARAELSLVEKFGRLGQYK